MLAMTDNDYLVHEHIFLKNHFSFLYVISIISLSEQHYFGSERVKKPRQHQNFKSGIFLYCQIFFYKEKGACKIIQETILIELSFLIVKQSHCIWHQVWWKGLQKISVSKILDQSYASEIQNNNGDHNRALQIYPSWPHTCLSDNLHIKKMLDLVKLLFTYQVQQEVFNLSALSSSMLLHPELPASKRTLSLSMLFFYHRVSWVNSILYCQNSWTPLYILLYGVQVFFLLGSWWLRTF